MLEDTQVEEVITQRSVVSVIQRKHLLQVTAGRFEYFYNNNPFEVYRINGLAPVLLAAKYLNVGIYIIT